MKEYNRALEDLSKSVIKHIKKSKPITREEIYNIILFEKEHLKGRNKNDNTDK